MFLYKRRVKSKKINHGIRNIREPINPLELEFLILRLRLGDSTVINTIVEGHLRLAINIAGQYAEVMQTDGLDYLAEGLLGIVTLLTKGVSKIKDNEITGLISCIIHRRISNYIARQRYKKKNEGVSINLKRANTDNESHEDYKLTVMEKSVLGEYDLIDLFEVLKKITKNNLERSIIKLRSQGYKDVEIGKILEISKTEIHRIRQALERRFNEELSTDP